MALLGSFTAPKWQHKNPDVRREGISQLDDEAILLELVANDPDPGVRAAALSRITRPDTLDGLIDSLTHALQAQAREQRLRQILPDAGQLEGIDDDALLVRIAGLSDDAGLVTAAMGRISSETMLAGLAASHPQARVRMAAAQNLTSLEVINDLMQQTRGRDKSLYRYCKAIIDEHHARQQRDAQRQEQIQQLLLQAGQLEQCASLAEFDSLHQWVTHPLKKLQSGLTTEQQQAFEQYLASGAMRRAHLLQRREAEELARAAATAANESYNAIIAELESLACGQPLPQTDPAQALAALQAIETRWQAARTDPPPAAALAARYHRILTAERDRLLAAQRLLGSVPRLEALLHAAQVTDRNDYDGLQAAHTKTRQFLDRLVLPEKFSGAATDLLSQLHLANDGLTAALEDLQRGQEKRIGHAQKALDALHLALEQNQIRQADQSLSRARNALRSLTPRNRERFEHELRPLAAHLKEMHDWQGFAIEPKKVALCARMADLIGSELDPDSLAARIKDLQEQWRLLGALPHGREQALWREFKALADQAWQPCQQAFDQRAELLRQNRARRMQIVSQLRDYERKMHWPDAEAGASTVSPDTGAAAPDWRMVQKTLDTARAAFHAIQPLTAKAEHRSHQALQAVCDRIYAHIKAEYGRNIAAKQALVERAGELATMADLPQAIEQAKQLQLRWKDIGITPVAVDRKLWKALRSACDAVFARLDEQRGQLRAELDAQVKHAESLLQQARALLQADEEHIPGLARMLSDLKQQLDQVELPRPVQQRIQGEFNTLQREATRMAGESRQRQQNESWGRLRSAISGCAAGPATPDRAGASGPGESILPHGLNGQLLQNFWHTGPAQGHDEALRQACIALEVLAGVESPAADKPARMAFQMQRLAKGLGGPPIEPEQALLDIIHGFIELRPTAAWAARFCATLENMKG